MFWAACEDNWSPPTKYVSIYVYNEPLTGCNVFVRKIIQWTKILVSMKGLLIPTCSMTTNFGSSLICSNLFSPLEQIVENTVRTTKATYPMFHINLCAVMVLRTPGTLSTIFRRETVRNLTRAISKQINYQTAGSTPYWQGKKHVIPFIWRPTTPLLTSLSQIDGQITYRLRWKRLTQGKH